MWRGLKSQRGTSLSSLSSLSSLQLLSQEPLGIKHAGRLLHGRINAAVALRAAVTEPCCFDGWALDR